jgi:hypothetical protein
MFDYKQIGIKLKASKMSVKGLAELLEIDPENLYKWVKGTKITDHEAYNKLEEWVSNKVENIPPPEGKMADKVVEDLAFSSRIHAEASLLREQNYQKMLLHITDRANEETQPDVGSILIGLQELLVELAMGKRWKSPAQAEKDVNNILYGRLKKKKQVDNQNG